MNKHSVVIGLAAACLLVAVFVGAQQSPAPATPPQNTEAKTPPPSEGIF